MTNQATPVTGGTFAYADSELSLWIISGLCLIALLATFYKMKGGFGPHNLRAVGIVFVASLVAILSIARADDLTTAMGILGAIVGYLFGSQRSPTEETRESSSVSIEGSPIGHGAKVAGRDINETLNRISGDIDQIKDSFIQMTPGDKNSTSEYLFLSSYDDDGEPIEDIAHNMKEVSTDGWQPFLILPSYDRRGLITVFRRNAGEAAPETSSIGAIYHGLSMTQLS
jgi:hypothetical protein